MNVHWLAGWQRWLIGFAAAAGSAVGQGAARVRVVDMRAGAVSVTSEALTVAIVDAEQRAVAEVRAYGYFAKGAADRPVMFLWNGGPGAASALLHAGFAAPQVADLAGDGGFVDNALTMIDRCDLIYVDPVGTGLSRAIGDADDKDFWSVGADARVAAQFVSTVLSQRDWNTRPVYLCGESYGGIRVAAMLEPLRELGVAVAGLVMISPALETRTLWTSNREDKLMHMWVDGVPTMAALAVADGKRKVANARADVDAVCEFAFGPLRSAVRNDEEVDFEEHEGLIARAQRLMARRTIARVGARDRYDARQRIKRNYLCGVSIRVLEDSIAEILEHAFGIAPIDGYEFMNRTATQSWHEPRRGRKRGYPWDIRATEMIAKACKNGRGPRVFIAGGWFDIVVPFAAARRLRQEGAFGKCEVVVRDYPGGHALYVDPAAHKSLIRDLRWWLGRRSV